MPLVYPNHPQSDRLLYIWRITESESFFKNAFTWSDEETAQLSGLSAKRQLEWHASRYLIKQSIPHRKPIHILKDTYGKPFIPDCNVHISLSHSADMVATLVHNTPCGIDIQKEVEKITRIAPKFCNGQELDFLPSSGRLSYYHIIWGAKESIYKAYGRKKLDFKKNIIIEPFEFDGQSTTFDARLITDQKTIMFQVTCFTYNNYYLVYALQQ